jgi:hypothetical protein
MCTKIAASLASACAGAVLLACGSFAAQAMPAATFQATHDGATLVAERCGVGWHRDLDGRCRRDGEIVINPLVPLAPLVEPAHVCPFNMHWSPRRRECIY